MNTFSDENLKQNLREAIDQSRNSEKHRQSDAAHKHKDDDEALLSSELESVLNNPLGLIGRRFYRKLMKHWPKPEDNYDWVYEPGIMEITPVQQVKQVEASSQEAVKASVPSLASVQKSLVEEVARAVLKSPDLVVANNSETASSRGRQSTHGVLFGCGDPLAKVDVSRLNAANVDVQLIDPLDGAANMGALEKRRYYVCDWSSLRHGKPLKSLSRTLEYLPADERADGRVDGAAILGNLEIAPKAAVGGMRWISPFRLDEFGKYSAYHIKPQTMPAVYQRAFILDECHRLDMRLTLKTLESVLQKYTESDSRLSIGVAAKPRNPFQAVCAIIGNLFKDDDAPANDPARENSNKLAAKLENRIAANSIAPGDIESIEWELVPYRQNGLEVKGSAGDMRNYRFTVYNHQMSLVCQDKDDQSPPVTIFKFTSDEPETVGSKMIDSFRDHHLEDKVVKLLGPLRDIVERQVRVH